MATGTLKAGIETATANFNLPNVGTCNIAFVKQGALVTARVSISVSANSQYTGTSAVSNAIPSGFRPAVYGDTGYFDASAMICRTDGNPQGAGPADIGVIHICHDGQFKFNYMTAQFATGVTILTDITYSTAF